MWVLLMVPVAAFAAVVALAGPRRVAAESSMQEMAEDLAVFAVAARNNGGDSAGPLPVLPPNCHTYWDAQVQAQKDKIVSLTLRINSEADQARKDKFENQRTAVEKELARLEAAAGYYEQWGAPCELMAAFIADDLESLGFDADSLRGFYTDALSVQELPEGQMALPCKVSPRVEVSDAVHVALTADWNGAGWAVAQVWPDGRMVGAEAIGRLTRLAASDGAEECRGMLDLRDDRGRPVWMSTRPDDDRARQLVQSADRQSIFR